MQKSHNFLCDLHTFSGCINTTKEKDYEKYDFIIGMESSNIRGIMRIIGSDPENKVSKLLDFSGGGDIADPWYTGNFDDTFRDVLEGCEALLNKCLSEV